MAKASFKFRNGTVVTIEGSPEEVKVLLELYGGADDVQERPASSRKLGKAKAYKAKTSDDKGDQKPDSAEIVNLIKDCDEAESIETQILDRAGQVNRVLLPLYIVHKYMKSAIGLTSGDISKVAKDLGVPINRPNASRTLSGPGSKYVIGDKVKVKGQAVRYKLSRRGVKYIEDVLRGNDSGR